MPAQTWIKAALKDRGLKSKDVASALSIPPPRVTDIFQGRREVQSDEILPLAQLLGLSTKSLLASLDAAEPVNLGIDETGPSLPVLGLLTGTGTILDLPGDYPVRTVPIPPDAESDDGLYCYVMGDDSLDQEIKPGALMIAGDPRKHFFPMVPNAIFIIRTADGGLTARQLLKGTTGEFWMVAIPSTPNPTYRNYPFSMLPSELETITETKNDTGTEDHKIVRTDDIVAGVMWVHRRYTPAKP